MNTKGKKVRRTNAEIDHVVMTELIKLVEQMGFDNVSVKALIARANLESNVFYRRYTSIDTLYDKLAQSYDFWINDTIQLSELNDLGPRKFFAKMLKNLYREFQQNAVMQKLLLWEMSSDNSTTRRTALMRDTMNLNMVEYYDLLFKPTKIDIRGIIAILISGIYYLILHKDRAPFCSINFNTPEGEKAFSEAVDSLVEVLFDQIDAVNQKKESFERMLEDGISKEKAYYYLGIDPSELDS